MYKIIPLLLLITMVSCKTWDEADQDAWKQACMENAEKWTTDKQNAQTYCDCVLQKMMQKYPDVNAALGHVDELATDTALRNCRAGISVK